MRAGWEYKKLGEVASYINGFAFKPEQWKESGIPIVRIQNLNNPEAPYNYYDGEVPEKIIIKDGDLLISWSASLGTYIWNGGVAYLNQHIFKVEFDKTDIDKMFLKYAVTSKLEAMSNLVHGATMKHIVKKDFDNTRIPVPPIPQQRLIVSELDEINSLIALKREQLKKYDELAQSLFYEMFGDPIENEKGWEVKKLGEVGTVITGSTPPMKDSSNYSSNDYCFVKPSDLPANGVGVLSSSETYISSKGFNLSRKLVAGSVLVSCIGSIGKISILQREATCNQQINAIIPNSKTKSIYLAFAIMGIKSIMVESANAPVVPIINKSTFSKFSIPLPPLSLQRLFAHRIEQIEEQKKQITAAIAKLETLLASRMQYWFE